MIFNRAISGRRAIKLDSFHGLKVYIYVNIVKRISSFLGSISGANDSAQPAQNRAAVLRSDGAYCWAISVAEVAEDLKHSEYGVPSIVGLLLS